MSARGLIVALALGFAGCPPNRCDEAGIDRSLPLSWPLMLTGSPTEFTVRLECSSLAAAGEITSVTAVATDSEGQSLAGEVVSFTPGGVAVVQFTPLTPGAHTIVARFEPAGVEARAVTYAMRDRSGEQPVLTFTTAQGCSQVLLAGSLVACQAGTQLQLLRAGVPVAQGTAIEVRSSGDAIWAIDLQGVHRWSVADGGVTDERLLFDTNALLRDVIATRGDELLLAQPGGTLFSLRPSNGALVRTTLDYETDSSMLAGLAVLDGGTGVIWLSATEVCHAEPASPKRCRPQTLRLLAAEGDGLWLFDDALDEVAFAKFGAAPTPTTMQFLRLAPSVRKPQFSMVDYPTSRVGDHLVAIDRETVRLEAWFGPATGWNAGGVTATHVWFGSGSNYVVYAR
jgi:hypothetical protein